MNAYELSYAESGKARRPVELHPPISLKKVALGGRRVLRVCVQDFGEPPNTGFESISPLVQGLFEVVCARN